MDLNMTSKPSTKQQPPPYPRPVEHVSAEEIYLPSKELTYQARFDKQNGPLRSGEDGTEVEAERRAVKRRRIESYATAYLRGEPLYIMSAQLKGPLGKPWKNPWAKTKAYGVANINTSKLQEVPETVQRRRAAADNTKDRKGVALVGTKRHLAYERATHEDIPVQWSANAVVPPSSPMVTSPAHSPGKMTISKTGDGKATRIKDWLKTNEKFMNESAGISTASPLPSTTNPAFDQPSAPSSHLAIQPPFLVKLDERDVAAVLLKPDRTLSNDGALSGKATRQVQSPSHDTRTGDGVHPTPSEIKHRALPNQAQTEGTALTSGVEPSTAKVKHGSLYTAPLKANFSPFEYKRAGIRNTANPRHTHTDQQHIHDSSRPHMVKIETGPRAQIETTGIPTGVNDEEAAYVTELPPVEAATEKTLKTSVEVSGRSVSEKLFGVERDLPEDQQIARAEQETVNPIYDQGSAQFNAHQQSRPLLSTSTSDINTVDLLPSAQKPSELVPTLSSNVHEHSLLADNNPDQTNLPDDQASDYTPIELVSDNDITMEKIVSEPQIRVMGLSASYHVPVSRIDVPLVPSSPIVPRSTQEILAGITPFTFSTIKKRTRGAWQETPVTATKKTRKTASFAPDLHSSTSSHGSIQSTMRGKISKTLSSPPPIIIKDSMRMDVSEDDPPNPNLVHSAKSILKPASSLTSIRQSKVSLFSECEQDRHATCSISINSGQNKGRDEEAYDLDAEIGEIGSFLSPWEVDKEMEGMAA